MPNEPSRILIFNVNWLGDVLFSTAAIRNIRYNFPTAYIACAIPSRCYQILKDNPHLDELIIFDEDDRHKGFMQKLAFVQQLKSKRFDAAYLLHRSFSRALLCRLAGIPQRIGHTTKKRAFLLTTACPPADPRTVHRIDYYLDVLEKAGLRVEDRFTEFYFSESDEDAASDFLRSQHITACEFLVGLNPAGNWLPKRWPLQHWARLADRLVDELEAKVLITGSQADVRLAKQITALMNETAIVAAGALSLKGLGALCKRLNVFVSADSGPLHIANAVGTRRVIALFGPTDPAVTGPYPDKNVTLLQKDVGCSIPCYVVNCNDRRCMSAIAPDEVFEHIARHRAG